MQEDVGEATVQTSLTEHEQRQLDQARLDLQFGRGLVEAGERTVGHLISRLASQVETLLGDLAGERSARVALQARIHRLDTLRHVAR